MLDVEHPRVRCRQTKRLFFYIRRALSTAVQFRSRVWSKLLIHKVTQLSKERCWRWAGDAGLKTNAQCRRPKIAGGRAEAVPVREALNRFSTNCQRCSIWNRQKVWKRGYYTCYGVGELDCSPNPP